MFLTSIGKSKINEGICSLRRNPKINPHTNLALQYIKSATTRISLYENNDKSFHVSMYYPIQELKFGLKLLKDFFEKDFWVLDPLYANVILSGIIHTDNNLTELYEEIEKNHHVTE